MAEPARSTPAPVRTDLKHRRVPARVRVAATVFGLAVVASVFTLYSYSASLGAQRSSALPSRPAQANGDHDATVKVVEGADEAAYLPDIGTALAAATARAAAEEGIAAEPVANLHGTADPQGAGEVGDVDVDAGHPCALPSVLSTLPPYMPNVSVEQAPAKLVYPAAVPGESVWPVLLPTGACPEGVWLRVTDVHPATAHKLRAAAAGVNFHLVRLPPQGLSTRVLGNSTHRLLLHCGRTSELARASPPFLIAMLNTPLPPAPEPPSEQRPHILMIGQDSLSRSAFLRASPTVLQLMRDPRRFPHHELFDFRYYHAHQHNTNPNLHVLYGNWTYVHTGSAKARHLGFDLDNDGVPDHFEGESDVEAYHAHEGWMWRHTKRRGYSFWWHDVTYLNQPEGHAAYNGPFKVNGMRYHAGVDLPSPHWLDRFGVQSRCPCLRESPPCDESACNFNRHRLDLFWDRVLDAWRRHSHMTPVFLSAWAGLAHMPDQEQHIRYQEAYDARGLAALLASPQARNAFIIYYSDHGVNFGAGNAQAGITLNMESKRPMLHIWAPKWWLQAHPAARAALLHNRRSLLTHYDMYRTLLEIMDGPGSWEKQRSPWQLSLLQPVPHDRGCEEAHIPAIFCTCVHWTDTLLTKQQRQVLEAELNRDLPRECAQNMRVAKVDVCRVSRRKRTFLDKLVTDEQLAWHRAHGEVNSEQVEDVVTRVVFRVNKKGQREEAPLMLATLFKTGDMQRVTELRQLSSYGPYIGCLTSLSPTTQQYWLAAEKCICP